MRRSVLAAGYCGRIATLGLAALGVVWAGSGRAQDRVQALFRENTALELRLMAPFRQLAREREAESEFPALLSYVAPDGRTIELDIGIKPRGNSRLRNCVFPPLRLEFDTSASGTLFAGQDTLKLVTHCVPSPVYEDAVAREFQIYRLYNRLTEYSFLVRWATIEYVDTDARRDPYTESGFLIEEDWAAAARLGLEVLELAEIEPASLDPNAAALLGLFQFMVGNADWSARYSEPGGTCCHNGKPLGLPGQSAGRIVVPYDFDQAGFVDAEYAVHNESLGLRGMQRLYRGFCIHNEQLPEAIARIEEARQDWLEIVDDEPLRERARRRGTRYIESGYEIIGEPRRVEREIIEDCRS